MAFTAAAKRRRLRTIAVLLLLILAAAGLFGIAHLETRLKAAAVRESRDDIVVIASALSEHLNRALESTNFIADSLALVLLSGGTSLVDDRIYERVRRVPHLRGWVFADKDGVVIDGSAGDMLGIPLNDRDWFAEAHRAQARLTLGHPEGGRYLQAQPSSIAATGRWTIPVARRIDGPDGTVAGYLVILLNPNYLTDIATRGFGDSTSRVRFYARDGTLLASSAHEIDRIGSRSEALWFLRDFLPRLDRGIHVGRDGSGNDAVAGFQLTEDGLIATEVSRDMSYVLRDPDATILEIRLLGAGFLGLLTLSFALFGKISEWASGKELAAARAELGRDLAAREAALLRETRERIDQLHAGVPAVIFTRRVEPDGSSRLLYRGGDVTAVMGWPARMFEGVDRLRNVVEISSEVEENYVLTALLQGESSVEYRVRQPDGSFRWIETRCRRLSRSADGGGEVVGYSVNMTARKNLEEQVRRLALQDPLTGLPNRRHLLTKLDDAVKRQKRSGAWAALIFLDLDEFKVLNDTHGHEAGDALLVQVARRLVANLREVDTVSRFGGDEFVILTEQLGIDAHAAEAALQAVLRKISGCLSAPFVIDMPHAGDEDRTVTHRLGASIGAALFPSRAPDAETLLNIADTCMYEAKRAGKGRSSYRVLGAGDA